PAWGRRAGSGSLATGALAIHDVDAPAGERGGDVLGDGGGDEHLAGWLDEFCEAAAAPGIQFGEHVVEDEDGIAFISPRVGAQELVGPEPQRERERPGFPVTRVSPSGKAA